MESPTSAASRVDFYSFLDRMRRPEAAGLFRSIKSFLASLSLQEPSAEADAARVQAFFTDMEAAIRAHPLWADATHQQIDHALEVVQFYYWKAPELAARRNQTTGSETVCYPTIQVQQSSTTELPLPYNHGLAQTIFGSYSNVDSVIEWDEIVLALAMWETYSEELRRKLSTFLPYWLSNETIFVVGPSETTQ